MDKKIETCPHCGNYVNGNIVRTDEQELTRTVAKKGVNKALLYIMGAILGTFIFPLVGTVLAVIICFIAAVVADSYSEKAANTIEYSLYKTLKYEYLCPKCGHKWVRYMSKNDDFTPLEILKREKETIIMKLSNSKLNQIIMSCFCGFLTLLSMLYCICNDFKTSLGMKKGFFGTEYEAFDYDYLWLFLSIVCVFAIIGLMYHLNKLKNVINTIKQVNNITYEEFRHSPLRFEYK